MGQYKKELEEKEDENLHSGVFCWRCSEEIPKDELEFSKESDGRYLCAKCRKELEKIQKE